MNVVERRRSARIPVFNEQAGVIHAQGRDVPVKIRDLSRSGLLFSFLETSSCSDCNCEPGALLELSIDHDRSVLHLSARVVRCNLESVAVEFEMTEQVGKKLDDKLRAAEMQNQTVTEKARAAATAAGQA